MRRELGVGRWAAAMRNFRIVAAWLCVVVLGAGCVVNLGPITQAKISGGARYFGFDHAAFLRSQWRVAQTGGPAELARWEVQECDRGRCVAVAETHGAGQVYNVLLSRREFTDDFVLSVFLRADGGTEDRGGGLVWRAECAHDYYVTRWNPLENNVRVYRVVDGQREELASADVTADPTPWHRLAVRATGAHHEVSFDGAPLLSVDDATFSGRGRIGLWTKADARTSFDDLELAWGESLDGDVKNAR
ncbi:MAG: hypothetical protein K8S98_16340 [Planctomycetes bacterium]|nr:hypothetical protein [Planctomycetota bacterium]